MPSSSSTSSTACTFLSIYFPSRPWRQARPQEYKPSEVEGMGDTCKLYRSLVLSGIMSCMCHSGRLLLTTQGDSAGGGYNTKHRSGQHAFLVCSASATPSWNLLLIDPSLLPLCLRPGPTSSLARLAPSPGVRSCCSRSKSGPR